MIASSHSSESVSNDDLLCLNFNQDLTSIAVGTKSGYQIFAINSVENLEKIYGSDGEAKDICLIERLFSSSLVAIVSLMSPRKLKVCHFQKGTEICNYTYSNTVITMKLNRIGLIVVLEETLYIHSLKHMKVLHTIRDTPPNPKGICALSTNNENAFLAYPGNSLVGEVQIFDVANLRAVMTIPAHDNPLAAMAFNSSADKLATASQRGTVIRVFSIPDGARLFEFRRGMKRIVTIGSLSFSQDSTFLCASSNTETVHIFKLETPGEKVGAAQVDDSWMGYFNKVLTTSASYLPSQVSSVLKQGRDFATVKLPFSGENSVCAIILLQKLPRIVIAGCDGYLYIYNLDPVDGGECSLIRQHKLIPNNRSRSASISSQSNESTKPSSSHTTSNSIESVGHDSPGSKRHELTKHAE